VPSTEVDALATICIPIGEPLSFDALKRLNPAATPEELTAAFERLPPQLQEEAWAQFRLRLALDSYGQDRRP